jgi:hypothetical protein
VTGSCKKLRNYCQNDEIKDDMGVAATCMEEMKNAYKIFVGNSEETTQKNEA